MTQIAIDIYKVVSENLITTLDVGEHSIGRGPLLQCDDKRISRNHAVICVDGKDVYISSTHINPCFYKDALSLTSIILPKNKPQPMKSGDRFGLLPEADYWFEIKVKDNHHVASDDSNNAYCDLAVSNLSSEENSVSGKREIEEEVGNESNSCKKLKVDEQNSDSLFPVTPKQEPPETDNNESESIISANNFVAEVENNTVTEESNTVKEENDSNSGDNVKIKEERVSDAETLKAEDMEDKSRKNNLVKDVKNEPSCSTSTENDESSSQANTTTTSFRDRCWYGTTCYRKSTSHRTDFSHPGDTDYDSDPNDDRPPCQFGAQCYRTNKQHRRDMKHPKTNVKLDDNRKNVPKTKRTRDAKKAKATAGKSSDEDEYDLDDPFLNDGSSDDFEPSDMDSSDDDSEWSGADNDEDEDTKRLLKEAKRLTRKK